MNRFLLSFLIAAILSWSVAARPAEAETQTIKLSGGAAETVKRIRGISKGDDALLIIDAPTMSPEATKQIFGALETLRTAEGRIYACVPKSDNELKEGSAIIAMACDALLIDSKTKLLGARLGWCKDATTRRSLQTQLAQLGVIDTLLADRFMEDQASLSWKKGSGFKKDESGDVILARGGERLALDSKMLNDIGIKTQPYVDESQARGVIKSPVVVARCMETKQRPKKEAEGDSGRGTEGTGGEDAGRKPAEDADSEPAEKSERNTESDKRGTDGSGGGVGSGSGGSAGSGKPPTKPAAPTPEEIKSKLAPKLAEYSAAMQKLHAVMKEFDEYYSGRRGIWTSEHKGLKPIWRDGSEHTRDGDTKVTCQRLQRDIKTRLSELDSLLKVVERIAKSKDHPDVVRLTKNKEILDGFKSGIERNKVSNYDTYYRQVLNLK